LPQLINSYQPTANSMAGKTILITGAAGGLGSALALRAAHLQADLILLDNHERKLNQLHDEIEAAVGKQPGLYPLDMRGATPEDYQQLAETVEDVFKGLHGLVHCAVTLGQITPFEHLDAKQWHETFAANLHGPVMLTKSLLPVMRKSANASIVFTTDDKTKAYWGAYGISKASILPAMQIIADELSSVGAKENLVDNQLPVICNAINPGPMRTGLRSTAYPGEDPVSVPAPDEKVPAYLYLLSDMAREMNGQYIAL